MCQSFGENAIHPQADVERAESLPGPFRCPLKHRITRKGRIMTSASAWPTEIRLTKDRRALVVTFDNNEVHTLSAEYLRVVSPSAEVQGHTPAERKLQTGKQGVEIVGVEPVGNYAVRILFDDLHSSGLYVWDYLRTLGRERDTRWATYLVELETAGKSR